MLKRLSAGWEALFLEERPSVSLGLFRIASALTVGLHVVPTLLLLGDNYLATAFREQNPSFFPPGVLRAVGAHPDGAVRAMAVLWAVSWLGWLLGAATQWSAALLQFSTYYFYARNSLHIGTLSFDILLVTQFLMLVTPYPGDSFSVDSLLSGDPEPWRRRRPIFLQRCLQLQLASTFFYTGLCKWTGEGNWLTDNPYYYLMHSPALGVIKEFPGRAFLAASPGLCYAIGLSVIAFEMTLPLWLFRRRTRPAAIAAGIGFQILLLATMHVPTIFFFLFPPMFLLFLEPESVAGWIERRRERNAARGRDRLVYDGACGFCRGAVARLRALDVTGRLEPVDFRSAGAAALDARLTAEACEARLHLLERDGRLTGGYAAFQRLALRLPLLWPAAPLARLPGIARIGEPAYAWVARHRLQLPGATCAGPDGEPSR